MCKTENPTPLGFIPPVYHQELPSTAPQSSSVPTPTSSSETNDQESSWWQVIKAGFLGGIIGGTLGGLMVVSSLFIMKRLGTNRK